MSVEPDGPLADTPEPAGLDAILSDAMDGYGEEPQAPAKESPDTPDIKLDERGRAHGADGKFVPKTTDSADAKPSAVEPAKAEATPPLNAVVEPPKPEPIQPHARWDEPTKALFATWSPDVQKAFLDRHNAFEGDYTRKTQELSEQRKSVEPLLAETQKWSPYLQQLGMSPDRAFGALLQAEYTLRTGNTQQKQAMLSQLARDYGISFNAEEVGQPLDPAISQLHQTVAGLQNQLLTFRQQQEQTERQKIDAELTSFSQSKDAQGQAKYPHYERVRQTMGHLMASGQAETLESAYTKAIRLDDELFNQTVEAEKKKAADGLEKARLEAVEKAKKAQPVKTSDGPPKGGTQYKGLDAHLGAALEGRFGN